tara:strand:- start:43 stop:3924 length:3882 start_codon:yes stop_codon:yes gene_type:complete
MVTILPKIIDEEEKITILPEITKEKDETELPKIQSNVLKGSVIDKEFDEYGDEKIGIVDKVKNFFTKDKSNLPKVDIKKIEDPILKQIAIMEEEYGSDSLWANYGEQVLKRTYLGTGRDVAQATIDFSNYLAKKVPNIDNNIIDIRLPEIKEPNYFGGSLARDLIGFMGGYTSVGKAGQIIPFVKNLPKATTKIKKTFKILMKGGLAEQFTFSPYEGRLSSLVEAYKDGKFSNAVTEYLQAKDTDSEDAARAKMFIEGSAIAIPLEVLFWAVGRSYAKIKSKKADTELDIEVKAKQTKKDGTVEIETKDIKPIRHLVENDVIKLKDNSKKINKLKKELEELNDVEPPMVETPIKISKNVSITIKNNNSQIKNLNKQIKILEKKQIIANKKPNSIPIKDFISLPERIKTLKQKVAKLELQNNSIKTKTIKPNVKKTEAHAKKVEKIVSKLKPLEAEQIIYKNTKVKIDPTEINTLRKELEEARAIKVERKVETFNAADGKIKKIITTDNVVATQKKNKIAAIKAKIKKLEQDTTIKNQRQLKIDRADIDEKIGSKPRTLEGLNVPEGISVKGLNTATLKRINDAAEELLVSGDVVRNPNLKLYEQISDLLLTTKLNNEVIEAILKKHNITLKEFAQFFGATNAQAGRTLQMLSAIQRRLNVIEGLEGSNKSWLKALDETNSGLLHSFAGILRRLDNVRRAMMVSQLATAVRNLESQTFKQGISVIQETLDKGFQAIHRVLFPNLPIKRVAMPLNTLGGFLNIFKQFRLKNFLKVKKETDIILKSFPKEGEDLFLRFSSDISNMSGKKLTLSPLRIVQKAADLVNIFNKTQEFLTRRAVFQARLNNLILNSSEHYGNRTLKEILEQGDTLIIRKQDIADAVAEALESTFAKNFNKFDGLYDSVAYKFIQFVNAVPFTLSLVIPFPRFLMNSLKFHFDFSPAGIIPMFSKKGLNQLKNGDYSQISKAAIGFAMLTTAYALRKQDYAGEKWYEFKFGDRYIDFRPFNPFVAYLYVADLAIRMENGTLRDLDIKGIASVFAGSRAGTGLYLLDKLIDIWTGNKPVQDKYELGKVVLGNIMSTYLTPMQTALDFMAQNNPELAIVKDSRGDPFWGQIKRKLPDNDLPPIYSATSIEYTDVGTPIAKKIVRESPGWRQVTGMSIVPEKNEAEKILDKNGFLHQEIFRSTGIPELDKAYKMLLAPKIAIQLSAIVKLPFFKKLDVPTQNYIIKKQLTKYKKDVSESLRNDSAVLGYVLEYDINKMSKDRRKIIDEYLGKEFLFELINEFQSGKTTKLPKIN